MRIALTAGLIGLVLTLVRTYMVFQATAQDAAGANPLPGVQAAAAAGRFAVEVTPDFPCAEDPFELRPAALAIALQGVELYRAAAPVPAGQVVRVDSVADVAVGPNEFYVRAWMAADAKTERPTLRVRVLRDGQEIGGATLTGRPGHLVEGPVLVNVAKLSN